MLTNLELPELPSAPAPPLDPHALPNASPAGAAGGAGCGDGGPAGLHPGAGAEQRAAGARGGRAAHAGAWGVCVAGMARMRWCCAERAGRGGVAAWEQHQSLLVKLLRDHSCLRLTTWPALLRASIGAGGGGPRRLRFLPSHQASGPALHPGGAWRQRGSCNHCLGWRELAAKFARSYLTLHVTVSTFGLGRDTRAVLPTPPPSFQLVMCCLPAGGRGICPREGVGCGPRW